jgi:integrase
LFCYTELGVICTRTSVLLHQALDLVLASLTPGNRLVCLVMLRTGLRVGDVVSLRADQIGPRFTVREAKTRKSRRVSLPGWLVDQIKAQAHGSPWAFPSPANPEKHRTRQAVWKDIKRAQKAFRIKANCGTHSMRKAYAVELFAKYGDLAVVRKALNHDNDWVTMLYAFADRLPEVSHKRVKA